jgi:hypothetical protein
MNLSTETETSSPARNADDAPIDSRSCRYQAIAQVCAFPSLFWVPMLARATWDGVICAVLGRMSRPQATNCV